MAIIPSFNKIGQNRVHLFSFALFFRQSRKRAERLAYGISEQFNQAKLINAHYPLFSPLPGFFGSRGFDGGTDAKGGQEVVIAFGWSSGRQFGEASL
jgi:hypothetical protein